MIGRLMEIGRCCGVEMNVEESKTIRISKQLTVVRIVVDQEQWRMWNISAVWVTW